MVLRPAARPEFEHRGGRDHVERAGGVAERSGGGEPGAVSSRGAVWHGFLEGFRPPHPLLGAIRKSQWICECPLSALLAEHAIVRISSHSWI